jgi:hypothetical protein
MFEWIIIKDDYLNNPPAQNLQLKLSKEWRPCFFYFVIKRGIPLDHQKLKEFGDKTELSMLSSRQDGESITESVACL